MKKLLIFAACLLVSVFVCICYAGDQTEEMLFEQAEEWAEDEHGDDHDITVTIDAGDTEEVSIFEQTKSSAEAGNVESQIKLAEIYYSRSHNSKWIKFIANGDLVEASKWYKKAAEQGSEKAQYEIGKMYYYGQGVSRDLSEAKKWFTEATGQGHEKAEKMLAKIKDTRFEQIKRSAEEGNAEAQYELAKMYCGVKNRNSAEAAKWYKEAAEQGLAEAQCELAWMYSIGWGVPKNVVEAAKWYENAAEQGIAEAQYKLGDIYYYRTKGVTQDRDKGLQWYRRAAEQGHKEAQWRLGSLHLGDEYFGGEGAGDLTEAKKWLNIAAGNGHKSARQKLDKIAFFERTKKSAEEGDAESQFKLGKIYLNAYGGFKYDRAKAEFWFNKAAEQGHARAQGMLPSEKLGMKLHVFRPLQSA